MRVVAPRAPASGRVARGSNWGPFAVAAVHSRGEHVGWGVVCGFHTDAARPHLKCKRQIRGTSDEERRLLLAWLLRGSEVGTDLVDAKTQHFAIAPRDLPLRDDHELEAERIVLFGS